MSSVWNSDSEVTFTIVPGHTDVSENERRTVAAVGGQIMEVDVNSLMGFDLLLLFIS